MPFNEHVFSNSLLLWFLSIYSYISYLSLKGFLIQDACSVLYINIRQSYPLCGYKDTSWFVKKCPTPGHKSTHDNTCCWENFRPSESAGGPDFAVIVHHWKFSACSMSALMLTAVHRWQWSFTTAKALYADTVSMPWNHGPWEMASVFQGSCLTLSLHLSDVNADVQYLHREGTQPLVDHTMCLHCWDLKVSLQLKRYFLPISCKPSTFSCVPPQMRQQEGKGDFAANFILLLI